MTSTTEVNNKLSIREELQKMMQEARDKQENKAQSKDGYFYDGSASSKEIKQEIQSQPKFHTVKSLAIEKTENFSKLFKDMIENSPENVKTNIHNALNNLENTLKRMTREVPADPAELMRKPIEYVNMAFKGIYKKENEGIKLLEAENLLIRTFESTVSSINDYVAVRKVEVEAFKKYEAAREVERAKEKAIAELKELANPTPQAQKTERRVITIEEIQSNAAKFGIIDTLKKPTVELELVAKTGPDSTIKIGKNI